MKENNILYSKNRVVFCSFLVWIQTIVLFIIGILILPHLNNQTQLIQKACSAILLFDVGLGILAFIIMFISVITRIFGKKVFLIIPIFFLIIAYFLLIYPKSKKEVVKYVPKQYSYTLLTSDLKMGSVGSEVQVLQSALTTKNYLFNKFVTGYYGEQTKKAVLSFQADSKIQASGIVDEKTRNAFNLYFGKDNDSNYYLSLIPTQAVSQNNVSNSKSGNSSGEWGVAQKVAGDDVTYTMNVSNDPQMATAQEIFDALNQYRATKGVHGLNWDGNLAGYAQERANYYASNGLDAHAGFKSYIGNTDNRKRLGFLGLGENGGIGYRLTGTHLIQWLFASDAGHEGNQLNSNWTDVGIGVSGTGVDIIFGYDRY